MLYHQYGVETANRYPRYPHTADQIVKDGVRLYFVNNEDCHLGTELPRNNVPRHHAAPIHAIIQQKNRKNKGNMGCTGTLLLQYSTRGNKGKTEKGKRRNRRRRVQ